METLWNTFISLPPAVIFAIALAIRLIIGMRQFNRRGLGGQQHFDSYFTGLFTLCMEWVLKWTANITILWVLLRLIT